MSWKSTVYMNENIHVWTEPNFKDYDEEKTMIYISNQAIEMLEDESDEVCFLLDSPEGQAVYNAFINLK